MLNLGQEFACDAIFQTFWHGHPREHAVHKQLYPLLVQLVRDLAELRNLVGVSFSDDGAARRENGPLHGGAERAAAVTDWEAPSSQWPGKPPQMPMIPRTASGWLAANRQFGATDCEKLTSSRRSRGMPK